MNNIKNIIIFILVGLCIFFHQCNKTYVDVPVERTMTEYREVRHSDTVYLPIPKQDTIYLTNVIPKPYIIKDIDDTSKHYNKYDVPFEDSLIKGIIPVTTLGTLEHVDLIYKLKHGNKIITNTDSIFITTTIEKLYKKNKLFLGSTLYYNQSKVGISFDALFKTKRDLMFGGGYDPFNKVINIKVFTGIGK